MVNENKNNVTDSIHRVLARKYRPLNFTKLVGQNNLIKTLSGSIERGRLAHAYILTGEEASVKHQQLELLQSYLIAQIQRNHLKLQSTLVVYVTLVWELRKGKI